MEKYQASPSPQNKKIIEIASKFLTQNSIESSKKDQ
jgi:hypothetical protein